MNFFLLCASPFGAGMPNPGERLGFNLVCKKGSPQNYKRGGGKIRVGGSCPKYPPPPDFPRFPRFPPVFPPFSPVFPPFFPVLPRFPPFFPVFPCYWEPNADWVWEPWTPAFGRGPIKTCMPTHAYFCTFHNSCCEGRKGINLMAHGSTFLLPFGQRKRPLRLMRKRRILSFAKFVAKGTHRNAPRVTFTCVAVAWMSILAILMFPSSP